MDASDITIAVGAFLIIEALEGNIIEKKRKQRKMWARRLFLHRQNMALLNDLDYMHIKNFTRMAAEDFENLICLVGPRIAKKDTEFRKAIPVQDRLAVTLRFLATGDSYSSLQYLFKISKQRIGVIIIETCNALIQELKDKIKIPTTPEEWLWISRQYEEKWQFPHCIGSMDGKHVIIQAPFNSGSDFYNYKSNFSIVLLALVDADYNFIFVDVGCQGRISDGGVFKNTKLHRKLENNDLGLPEDYPLSNLDKPMPYVFLADEAFALTKHIMKPFSGINEKNTPERTFNYRLSRARRVVENVFGILSATFRVLRKPILLSPEKAQKVVMASCCLHNYLRKSRHSKNIYTPPGRFDQEDDQGNFIPGSWRQETPSETSLLPLKNIPRKSAITAKEIRNNFAQYIMLNK